MLSVKINSVYLQLYYGAEGSELTTAQWFAVKQISIYWAFVGIYDYLYDICTRRSLGQTSWDGGVLEYIMLLLYNVSLV